LSTYASLLHLTGQYRLVELRITRNDWLDGRSIREAGLRDGGIDILGIHRSGGTISPTRQRVPHCDAGDLLVLCGSIEAIKELDRRKQGKRGDREHHCAVHTQEKVVAREARQDTSGRGPPSSEV
jgi:Trk K+ transport system NAD-binding subunit